MFFKRSGADWLIVFLGNPGREYENTRHNAGFRAADAMEKLADTRINKLKFRALTGRCAVNGQSVLLMKPQTYMNLSGEAVGEAARFYKLPPERVIVISDETALVPGRIRVRRSGSAGGHNGLKSVISALGSDAFPRIRIGVGEPPHRDFDKKDWVLGRFSPEDDALVSAAAERAAKAALCCVTDGAERAMNLYNSNA